MNSKIFKKSQYRVIGYTYEIDWSLLPPPLMSVSLKENCCGTRFVTYGSLYAFVSHIDFIFFKQGDIIRVKPCDDIPDEESIPPALLSDFNILVDQIVLHTNSYADIRPLNNKKILYEIVFQKR